MPDEEMVSELLKVRDADRAERARANREERIAERDAQGRSPSRQAGEQELRVTINAPNTANVNGRSVAINIADQMVAPAGAEAGPPMKITVSGVCIDGVSHTIVFWADSVIED